MRSKWKVKGRITSEGSKVRYEVTVYKRRRFWFPENVAYRTALVETKAFAQWDISNYVQGITGIEWELK